MIRNEGDSPTPEFSATCVSCGQPAPFGARYAYCSKCDQERNDTTLKPLVWEYMGGRLGRCPNMRGPIDFTLQKRGFIFVSERPTPLGQIPIYVREDDKTPMGLIAIKTLDNFVVILSGKEDLDQLLADETFYNAPLIANLPKILESSEHEKLEAIQQAIQTVKDTDEKVKKSAWARFIDRL
jgi:hypothetical protein